MKRLSGFLIIGLALVLSQTVSAQEYACGGNIEYEGDCHNTDRPWITSCCPDGYRVQGVAYNDVIGQDHVDAFSAVCRSISKGNDMMPGEFTHRGPNQFVCEKQEVMAGLQYKDVKVQGGDNRDTLDGVNVLCQRPSSKAIRAISNMDVDHNPRMDIHKHVAYLPKRVVGIAYRELDKGSSDRADCVTIITK